MAGSGMVPAILYFYTLKYIFYRSINRKHDIPSGDYNFMRHNIIIISVFLYNNKKWYTKFSANIRISCTYYLLLTDQNHGYPMKKEKNAEPLITAQTGWNEAFLIGTEEELFLKIKMLIKNLT